MARTLVVYYSLTGLTRKVAEEVARAAGAHLAEIRDRRPRTGVWGQIRGGYEALFGLAPAIEYTGPDPATYDLVMIGAPVWCSRLASPVRSFLRQYASRLPKVGLFVTYGGRGAGTAVAKARPWLHQAPEHVLEFLDPEISSGTFAERVRAFAHSLHPVAAGGLL